MGVAALSVSFRQFAATSARRLPTRQKFSHMRCQSCYVHAMTALKRSAAILFIAALIVPASASVASAKTTKAINLGSLTTLIQSLTKSSGTSSNPLAGLNLAGLNLGNLNLGNLKGIDLTKLK